MPRIDLDGLSVHYQQTGTGPDVVLLHAFTSNLSVWYLSDLVSQLAEEFRVTAYDLRGHGKTDVPPRGYTSSDLADDFAKLHAALGLERAALTGHSFGGVVAMHAAVRYPERVRAVILSDSYFPGLRRLEPDMTRAVPWRNLRETFATAGLELGETVDFARLFATMASLTEEQSATLRRTFGAPGARWLKHLAQLSQTTAAVEAFEPAGLDEAAIRSVAQPVVALYDEQTSFAATRDFLVRTLPCCAADVVVGAGHLAPVESSAAFVERVRFHLRRLLLGCGS